MNSRPSSIRVVHAIGRVTFSEILRDKVLYGALVTCILLLLLGALISRISFIRPDRILLDYGLLALALSSGFLGILTGAVVLAREFDRRTIFMALARPISRLEFLVGKYFGIVVVLALNSLFVSLGYVSVLWLLSDGSPLIGATLWQALGLLGIQSLLLAALSIFFSAFSTPSLAIILTFGLYLVGVNVSQVRMFAVSQDPGPFRWMLDAIATVLPNFEHFNLGLKVSYGLAVPASFVAWSVLYALIWIALLLGTAGSLLERKES